MPVKRRLTGSSTSHLAMEAAAGSASNRTTVMKADAAGEPSRSEIFTIGYPVCGGESDQLKIGGFLERCHYCKKQTAKDSEIFMYGNLRAFCSAECRDNQMTLDNLATEQPSDPKQKAKCRSSS